MKKFLLFWEKYEVPESLALEGFGPPPKPGALTWEKWEANTQEDYPVQYFVRETVPSWGRWISRKLGHVKYWIRAHTYNRYHHLSLANKATGYSWGYIDTPEAILYAAMNLFQRFCEKEDGLKDLAFQATGAWGPGWTDEESAPMRAERAEILEIAKDLYQWWCLGYRQHEHHVVSKMYDKAVADGRNPLAMKAWYEALDNLNKRDDEQLAKLLKIRNSLWT